MDGNEEFEIVETMIQKELNDNGKMSLLYLYDRIKLAFSPGHIITQLNGRETADGIKNLNKGAKVIGDWNVKQLLQLGEIVVKDGWIYSFLSKYSKTQLIEELLRREKAGAQ